MAPGLEDLLGSVLGGKSGGQGGALGDAPGGGGGRGGGNLLGTLAPVIMGMLARGGLQKILAGFQKQGLTSQADSWVSKGPNEPVTGDQVRQARRARDQPHRRPGRPARGPDGGVAGRVAPRGRRQATQGGQVPQDDQQVANALGLPGLK